MLKTIISTLIISASLSVYAVEFKPALYRELSFEDNVTVDFNLVEVADSETLANLTNYVESIYGGKVINLFQAVPTIYGFNNIVFLEKDSKVQKCVLDIYTDFPDELDTIIQCIEIRPTADEKVWEIYIPFGGTDIHAGRMTIKDVK